MLSYKQLLEQQRMLDSQIRPLRIIELRKKIIAIQKSGVVICNSMLNLLSMLELESIKLYAQAQVVDDLLELLENKLE
jgi:hypothetical protein